MTRREGKINGAGEVEEKQEKRKKGKIVKRR
jgi:hypothetical protein